MATKLWWIIQKDLICEYRARRAWPCMILLGVVVAFLLSYQTALTPSQLQRVGASLCWLTICFAAVLTLGQSIAMERDDGCWEALLLYPVTPQTVYVAKTIVNGAMVGALQLVVVPFFAVVCDAQWLSHPGELLLISVLANLGITSVGTLLGAISSGMSRSQGLLALLLLPLLVPVILAASEATRLIAENQVESACWHWVQLLGAFAIVYFTTGWMLFEFVVED